MYLKQSRFKTGRIFLSIVHGYWDSKSKQSRTKTIQKIGYLDELQKEFDNPVSHFTSVAAEMDKERKATQSATVTIDLTKSILGTRPVYVQTEEHINAHFLTCFISLLIARIVELRLGGRHSITKITETLRKVACSHIEQNIWLFDFANELTDDMNAAFGTDFGRKAMTLQEIKNNLGNTKKS